MAAHPRGQQRPPADYSAAARTGSDQEYTYLAIGMVAGAVPGVIIGLLLSLAIGHAAMWVSIVGGVGIIIGLVVASLLWRRRKASVRPGQAPDDVTGAPTDTSGRDPR